MADALDLQVLCQELLDESIDALDTIPTFDPGLGGAPDRSFVSPGQPQYDCCPDGQLTVHVAPVTGTPLVPLANQTRRNTVALVVTILRCVPVAGEQGGPAPVALVGAAAEQHNADGWALWNYLFNQVRSGALFRLCDPIEWLGLRPITPSGGCGGWTLTITVQQDGY